ncbi:hypothetical protein [Nostoc sp. PCC 9305]
MMNYLDIIIAKCVSAFFKRWRTRPPEAIAAPRDNRNSQYLIRISQKKGI